MASIDLIGLSKSYGETRALDGLSLSIENNEFFCIFGPPTSGKTTALRLILGLETPDAGEVRIGGRSMAGVSPGDRNIAMVFQNLALFPHLTARGNIRFPLEERKVAAAEIDRKVEVIASKLHISRLLDKMPSHLSGGERQRVAIARALVRDPAAYLMDDPISALDARLREEMRVELKRIQSEIGHTLVYVTHDQEEAMSVADRMAILENGRVRQVGTPTELYADPNSRYVANMLGSPAINMLRGSISESGFNNDDVRLDLPLPASQRGENGFDLGIRPEAIECVAGEGNGLAATVTRAEVLGGYTLIDLKAGAGTKLRASARGFRDFKEGQPVSLRIAPKGAFWFDAASGDRVPA